MTQLVLIAIGLSMDAFSVSVVSGICYPGLKKWQSLRAAAFFGGFQGIMPLIGWYVGSIFSGYIRGFDHWIAFALLAAIGGKMAFEAIMEMRDRRNGKECGEKEDSGGITRLGSLVVLSFATSIDAAAVGISLNLLGLNVFLSALFIAVVTFLLSLAGVLGGRRIGSRLGEWAEIAGGLILAGIGVKILLQHLVQGL